MEQSVMLSILTPSLWRTPDRIQRDSAVCCRPPAPQTAYLTVRIHLWFSVCGSVQNASIGVWEELWFWNNTNVEDDSLGIISSRLATMASINRGHPWTCTPLCSLGLVNHLDWVWCVCHLVPRFSYRMDTAPRELWELSLPEMYISALGEDMGELCSVWSRPALVRVHASSIAVTVRTDQNPKGAQCPFQFPIWKKSEGIKIFSLVV